jgi:C-terminal processing protease CtpA/Prc
VFPNILMESSYSGPLFVLAGGGCASACENFLMPRETTGLATIIGQKTEGTSGQPFLYNFGNGMLFRVSSKRIYFPIGRSSKGWAFSRMSKSHGVLRLEWCESPGIRSCA